MRLAALIVFLSLTGCRDSLTGPGHGAPPLDLSPDVVGSYAGVFEGEVGLIGTPDSTVQDTFRLAFDFRRLETETAFSYQGELLRGSTASAAFYDCGSGPLVVSDDREVQIDCVQGSQLGRTLVLRLDARFDSTFDVLRETIRDVNGVEGAEYAVELRRSAATG